jgi:DNA-directed RNA polymerase specialized sigma24 family protein
VAGDPPGTPDSDDAELLTLVRAGDRPAFGLLYQRHCEAAGRLARELVVSPAEIDEVVSETFARVLDAVQRGGGPADAFRPYVLTAVRRVCHERFRGQRAGVRADEHDMTDPGRPFLEPNVASLEDAHIVRAFLAMPERWQALLWHTAIEQEDPDEVTPLFGLSHNGLAAFERRAREGLRQAYLEMYIARVTRQECVPVAERFGAFLRYALSAPETSEVAAHLADCDECRAVYSALADVGATLRSVVAPVFLGSAAASYLSGTGYLIAAGTVIDAAAAGALEPHGAPAVVAPAGLIAGELSPVRVPRPDVAGRGPRGPLKLRQASGRQRLLAVVAAAALAMTGVTAAIALSGHGPHGNLAPSAGPGTGTPVAVASAGPNAATRSPAGPSPTPGSATSRPGASPAPSGAGRPRSPATPSASASPTSAGRPSASPSPTAAPSPAGSSPPAHTVQLTATIDVFGGQFGYAQVSFVVTDTGTAAAGELTASITLPAGSSMLGGHRGRGREGGGWACQPTSAGASCQHDPVSAGASAHGTIAVQLSGSAACGQPVQLTATSGAVSTSAQSPEDIQCQSGGDAQRSALPEFAAPERGVSARMA